MNAEVCENNGDVAFAPQHFFPLPTAGKSCEGTVHHESRVDISAGSLLWLSLGNGAQINEMNATPFASNG